MEARMSFSKVSQEYSFCAFFLLPTLILHVLGKMALYDGLPYLRVARITVKVQFTYTHNDSSNIHPHTLAPGMSECVLKAFALNG